MSIEIKLEPIASDIDHTKFDNKKKLLKICLKCDLVKINKTCLGRFQDCGRGKGKNM